MRPCIVINVINAGDKIVTESLTSRRPSAELFMSMNCLLLLAALLATKITVSLFGTNWVTGNSAQSSQRSTPIGDSRLALQRQHSTTLKSNWHNSTSSQIFRWICWQHTRVRSTWLNGETFLLRGYMVRQSTGVIDNILWWHNLINNFSMLVALVQRGVKSILKYFR